MVLYSYLSLHLKAASLHKYLLPGAGRALHKYDEDRYGMDMRMPDHYRRYHKQWRLGPQEFIHIRGPEGRLYEKDEFGQVQPVEVPNIKPIFPAEFHWGLWGGEGIVKGFKRAPPKKHQPQFEWPSE